MFENIWTGLAFGLLGSLHCIGMCGPIAVALPFSSESRTKMIVGRLLYNAGRTLTYGLFGLVAGLLGEALRLTDYQQALSIAAGVIILIMIILPSKLMRRILPTRVSQFVYARLDRAWAKLTGKRSTSSLFLIGILNGFLPCGLVYLALAGALGSASILSSVMYMVLFGIGTTPVMFATSIVGPVLGVKARRSLQRLIPVGATVLALLLILRGMSLGIPYVSPKMSPKHSTTQMDSCH
jgi:sulfite exporter TauE/SafE